MSLNVSDSTGDASVSAALIPTPLGFRYMEGGNASVNASCPGSGSYVSRAGTEGYGWGTRQRIAWTLTGSGQGNIGVNCRANGWQGA